MSLRSIRATLATPCCSSFVVASRGAAEYHHANGEPAPKQNFGCAKRRTRVPSGRQAVTFFMIIWNRSALARGAERERREGSGASQLAIAVGVIAVGDRLLSGEG
jgi:hypothetical protein